MLYSVYSQKIFYNKTEASALFFLTFSLFFCYFHSRWIVLQQEQHGKDHKYNIVWKQKPTDGAWWRHKAPSAVEMMKEAWKNGRQVCRLLLAMDRWKGERFRGSSRL